MSCDCQTWYQYLIESLPSILLIILAGGGGTLIYKFKDRISRLLSPRNIGPVYQNIDDYKKPTV